MRVLIVGGGIIGLSCAWHLARDGHRIILLDGAIMAREASWAAAGMLAPHHEADGDTPLWRLCAAGLERWPGFLAALGSAPEAVDWREGGGWIRCRDATALQSEEDRLRWLRAAGIAVDRLSPAAFTRACPGVDPGAGALWLPGAQVDPRRVLTELDTACRNAGVSLRYGEAATAIAPGRVKTASGNHPADVVILASGAWTPALAGLSGIELPGDPVKGQLLRLDAPCTLPGFVRSGHRYLLGRDKQGVVVGATMVEAGFDRSPDPEAIASLTAWAGEVIPALHGARIAETWTGLRPRLAIGRPVIGWVRPGLMVASGHFRNGVLLAPLTGELVAAAVQGNDAALLPFDLSVPQR